MRKPTTVKTMEDFGRVQLSKSFFMREFLYSEIASMHGLQNLPDDPDLAIEAGRHLCEQLLEPLNATFGRIVVRSAYRSCEVNQFGNERGYNCASNEKNYAGHIWDRRDGNGLMGATACIVIPWFAERYEADADWRSLAWWIHDHLPYSRLQFFPRLCAFNIRWYEKPERRIDSFIVPKGTLTKPSMENSAVDHSELYENFPNLVL
ncbi:MAG: hypothetical protein RJS97_22355 [Parvibaculaceae bacterium]